MTMLSGRQLDWERQRLWREDCDRRFAARVEEQRWLHELEPERYSLLVPVDDEEWGTEAFMAGWSDEEPSLSPDSSTGMPTRVPIRPAPRMPTWTRRPAST